MSHIPLAYKICMVLVMLIGGSLIVSLNKSNHVSLSDLKSKSGGVLSAECVKSSSVHGIKALINYSGVEEKDFFNLPIDVQCQEVISEIIGKDLKISYFENAYFGISVKGKVIRDTEQSLSDFNDKSSSINFIFFIVLVSTFLLYLKGRHVKSC